MLVPGGAPTCVSTSGAEEARQVDDRGLRELLVAARQRGRAPAALVLDRRRGQLVLELGRFLAGGVLLVAAEQRLAGSDVERHGVLAGELELLVLVVQLDLPRLGRTEQQRRLAAAQLRVVHVLVGPHCLVDEAVVVLIEPADAERELVVHDRHVDTGLVQLVEAALRAIGQVGREAAAELGERRLLRDVAHRAAHRRGAEQRALRSLDHFDALDVAEQRVEREVRAFGERGDRAVRNVVEIDADRGRREDVGDAAHRDRALPRRTVVVEVHAGHVLEHAAQRGEAAGGEGLRIDDCDRRRDVLDLLGAARGRDDDFLEADLIGGIGRGRTGQGD